MTRQSNPTRVSLVQLQCSLWSWGKRQSHCCSGCFSNYQPHVPQRETTEPRGEGRTPAPSSLSSCSLSGNHNHPSLTQPPPPHPSAPALLPNPPSPQLYWADISAAIKQEHALNCQCSPLLIFPICKQRNMWWGSSSRISAPYLL